MPPKRVDSHVHVAVLGLGQPALPSLEAPTFMEPQSERGAMSWRMRESAAFKVFLFYNRVDPDRVSDTLLRERIKQTIRESSLDYVVCLALDAVHLPDGERRADLSSMWVANEFVVELAQEMDHELSPEERGKRGILFGASVHPYARNFRDRVAWCVDNSTVLLKWLPSAQQIDLADERVGDALEFLATAKNGQPLPVLIHVGAEYAVTTTDPRTASFDFLSWSFWDAARNRLRSENARWAKPDVAGIGRNVERAMRAGARIIFAHCGLPYYAPRFLGRVLEHSDLASVERFVKRYQGKTEGIPGKCFADVSAVLTPFRKSYYDDLRRLPPGSLLAGSDFPVPVFELSAGVGETLADLRATLAGDFTRIIVPEGNLLDVNWRELEHAFPGHPMFENWEQLT